LNPPPGEISPYGGEPPERVQVPSDSVRLHRSRWARRDLNPHTGEISPISGMNTETSEKSPNWGSHASTIAGAPRPASSKFGRLRPPGSRSSGTRGFARARACRRSCLVFCLVQQGDGPNPDNSWAVLYRAANGHVELHATGYWGHRRC
jgi:hypothetical protein